VRRLDPAALWSSINGNRLPSVSASLVHPHLQSAHDAYGLTSQRLLVERSGEWKVLSRSTPEPGYRSDATHFELIYGEALIDLSPAEVADSVRPRF
jgi:hypothetical protein